MAGEFDTSDGDYTYDVLGWSDVDGNRYDGFPPDHAFGPDFSSDQHIDGVLIASYLNGDGDAVEYQHIDGVLIASYLNGDGDAVEYHWVYMTDVWESLDDMHADIEDSIDMYGMAS